jgi:S-(hydroxymethyl)glutathione dehydrogenase/alcohol dehydrogenase
MRAAVLRESPGRLKVEDIRIDTPRETEVLVQVAATGICHSDLRYLDRAVPLPRPKVLGHEAAGRVVAVGGAVSGLAEGDHVVGFSIPFCGRCARCVAGDVHLCASARTSRPVGEAARLSLADGSPVDQFAGLSTFAEQMLVHESSLVRIDRDVPLDVASLLGCAVPTGVGAVLRTAAVRPGATVVVIGCGGIGLNCVQGARIAGARTVVAVDLADDRLALATRMGATSVLNPRDDDVEERVGAMFADEGGADFAFEAAGGKATAELAVRLLRPGGLATVIGMTGGTLEISATDLLYERRVQGCVMGSVAFTRDIPYLLDLYRDGRLLLDQLIGARTGLENVQEAIEAMSEVAGRSLLVLDGVE